MSKVLQTVPELFRTMMEAQTRYRRHYQQEDIEDISDDSEAIFGSRSPTWMTNLAELVAEFYGGPSISN